RTSTAGRGGKSGRAAGWNFRRLRPPSISEGGAETRAEPGDGKWGTLGGLQFAAGEHNMTQESFSFPSEFEVSTRHLVMERHLNPYGNVFGGTVLAWLDEGAALFLMEKIGYTNFVTVSMNHVDFKAPGHRGDAVQILCRVLRTGRSSVTV